LVNMANLQFEYNKYAPTKLGEDHLTMSERMVTYAHDLCKHKFNNSCKLRLIDKVIIKFKENHDTYCGLFFSAINARVLVRAKRARMYAFASF
jgi:hypothetical protein